MIFAITVKAELFSTFASEKFKVNISQLAEIG